MTHREPARPQQIFTLAAVVGAGWLGEKAMGFWFGFPCNLFGAVLGVAFGVMIAEWFHRFGR